jgi:hypothetical protein
LQYKNQKFKGTVILEGCLPLQPSTERMTFLDSESRQNGWPSDRIARLRNEVCGRRVFGTLPGRGDCADAQWKRNSARC